MFTILLFSVDYNISKCDLQIEDNLEREKLKQLLNEPLSNGENESEGNQPNCIKNEKAQCVTLLEHEASEHRFAGRFVDILQVESPALLFNDLICWFNSINYRFFHLPFGCSSVVIQLSILQQRVNMTLLH